jgi:hypothetical protein
MYEGLAAQEQYKKKPLEIFPKKKKAQHKNFCL